MPLCLQIACLEEMTRKQSQSKSWFAYRSGRITASTFKSAIKTDLSKPALSLIKRICYPDAYKFQTAATKWVRLPTIVVTIFYII